MIIPGFIGGRMVKFVEEITLALGESQSFYHFYDNRILPSHVDADMAKKEGARSRACSPPLASLIALFAVRAAADAPAVGGGVQG